MRRFPPSPRRTNVVLFCALVLLTWISTPTAQQPQQPIADPNVNMVRGITFPNGDPFLQRQNEPSIAVSTRNPCHLLAGANDYRSVDIPFDDTPLPQGAQPNISMAGDAWLGLFKSFDCGQKWESTLLPGYPQDNSGLALTLKGHEAGADPTVRAGSNGLFFYSGMVFNRGAQGNSKIFVARLIDNNNKERGDPIEFVDVATIDIGTKGQFLDKPWLAVDVPRNSFGPGSTLATGASSASGTCTVNGQQIPASNAYMAYARFTGESSQHAKLMFARSTDCGKTWKTNPLSNNQQLSQGANIAIAPHDGTVYVTWREFATEAGGAVSMWITVSSDGGQTFGQPRMIAGNVRSFDQISTSTKFRSNALPAITADHENRVYVAWSEVGYATTVGAGGAPEPTNDARIVMTVSSDRGQTFTPRFVIDPSSARGHQMMPSLTFAAGKIQAIYYDSREDQSGVHRTFIDDVDIPPGSVRHTIDVRGVQADPGPQPLFLAGGLPSLEISKYRQWSTAQLDEQGKVIPGTEQSIEIGANPPNLAMYAAGSLPFMGDYIDVSGLTAFPMQTSTGQVWQPNVGPINLMNGTAASVMTHAFPTLPIFHAVWTDNRDVRVLGQQCEVPPDPSTTGERNANIYTSRITPGLFVGSPGNTKPLGFRKHPVTGEPTGQLIQRGFVVFAQNTTNDLKFFEFRITNQPAGGRASFRQFEKDNQPLQDRVIVSIPKMSTEARTVFASSTDVNAQLLVNVQEMMWSSNDGQIVWSAVHGGLRGSILLNPDRTNPPIIDPDVDSEIPQIATTEIHNPSLFTAQFFVHRKGTSSRQLDVKNPDPESPDPESPDPENPDPESPDPESPDPESNAYKNPDPESPDPESPDPESPDPESPDPESVSLLNTAISPDEAANSTITDINWRVHNSGNTTSAYRFRPVLQRTGQHTKYQLIVTRRYMMLTMDPATCKPIYKSQNQVVVNIVNFDPKAPDPESPDPESPDPESPDPESPDPESPDPESPDPESASFFLAPDETATVTLRAFTPPEDEPPTSNDQNIAAKAAAQKANTGETKVSSAVTGPDLTLFDEPFIAPPTSRSGQTINVTWTLTNRGTADAVAASGNIRTNVYFSTDAVLSTDDVRVGNTVLEPSPFEYCREDTPMSDCSTTTTTPVTMPNAAGQYFVIVVTDDDNDADDPADPGDESPDPDREVFEADELNNVLVIPVRVDAYQLAFVQQPSPTTQDYTMSPAVTVMVTHPDGQNVTAADVPGMTVSIQNNAGGGTLSGTLTRPNAGGVATFSDLRIDEAGAGYTLAANAPFSTGAVSTAFAIEVDAPPVTGNDSYSVNEDGTLNVPAAGVLANDADAPSQGIAPAGYGLTAELLGNPANGTAQVNGDGSISYAPHENFNGTDTFTYRARDGRPGNFTTGTITVTVNAVNDVPSFIKGADQSVPEDAGLQLVPGWASEINPGAANESSQALEFLVTNDNNALFSTQPAISAGGTLTYQSAQDRDGVATVTVRLRDNGGTANGGVDTSAAETFTITVNGGNDAPLAQPDTYTAREDTTLTVDAGNPQGGIQGLLFNDSDGEGQLLIAEYLTTTSNGTLLPHQNGSFSYTPNPQFSGTDSFTYRAFDGAVTGNTVTVTIIVEPVNDAPSFVKGDDQVVPMNALTQVFAWASQISAGAANEGAQALTFITSNDNTQLFSVQPAVTPEGTLTFTPRNNREGVANVTVQLQDNGGTANGGANTSAVQTFTINVTSAVQNYVVTNTNDSGLGSLRAAITNANANASHDLITFNISGSGIRTITPLSPLPAIVFPVTINATTQPGFSGSPIVELNGASAGSDQSGFVINTSNVTVRGFIINRFSGSGIDVTGTDHVIIGNYIGTNAAGTAALGNGAGIRITGASGALIGGAAAGSRNVISGNNGFGIDVTGSPVTPATIIQGNFIGLTANGANALGNLLAGVKTSNSAVIVGGTSAAQRNVIAANAQGVILSNSGGTFHSVITGNYFGTDVTGMVARGNSTGILIGSAPGTRVGGELPGEGNLIAGNTAGVTIEAISHPVINGAYNTLVQGNTFGVNAAGGPLPNGVGIAANNNNNLIGGTSSAAANVIAHNTNAGIRVASIASGNQILRNSMHSNGGLGIDLTGDGLTPNDAGDADTGANGLQNFPVLTVAFSNGVSTTVSGTINTTPLTQVTIELFSNTAADATGHGEGRQFLGTVTLATDAAGNASFTTSVAGLSAGSLVTATATAQTGTSEFSLARAVTVNTPATATADSGYTISGQAATLYPGANDIDPDVASPQVRTTYKPLAAAPNLASPGDLAIVSATGLGYFTGGNLSAGTTGQVGIFDLATNAVTGAIPMTVNAGSSLTRVSQSTRIAYMRTGNFLQAIDGRPASPTFNQSILNVFFGPINSMALNETTKRLYATANSTGLALIPNGRVVVLDIDPSSPTFHQILDQITIPSANGTVTSVNVNPATNKVYFGATGVQSGMWVLDGASHTLTQVGNGLTAPPLSIVVNDVDNLIYGVQGANVFAVDGATDQRIATIPLPAQAGGTVDGRLAVHRGNGKVFVRLSENTNPSDLVVIDGARTSATFNQIVATIPLGRDNGAGILAIDEAANRLIATSTTDHESAVIDTAANAIVDTVKSTQTVVHATIDGATHRAYVTGSIGHLQVIDLTNATVVSNAQVGIELFGVAVDPLTHSAYVAQTGASTAVVRLDHTGTIGSVPLPHVDGRQTFLARNGVTNTIYALNSGSIAAGGADGLPGFVNVIDGVSNTVTASVPVGGNPFGLAVDEVNNRIYVGNSTNGFGVPAGITVINGVDNTTAQANLSAMLTPPATSITVQRDLAPNTATGKLYFRAIAGSATQLGVLNGLVGSPLLNLTGVNIIRVNPVLNRVYVGQQSSQTVNQIHVLNGATDQLIATINAGFPTAFVTTQSYLAVNTTTGRLYAADFLNHRVSVIDGATNTALASIPVGRGPSTVAINQAANRIYVGNAIERSLTIIDGATNRVVRTLALPIAPVIINVDDSLSPARLFISSTAVEASITVVDDPGTAAPQITAVTQPGNGSVVLNADGSVTYTPNAGFSGTDSYTYTVTDGDFATTTATAFVTVAPALSITTVSVPNGMIDVPYSHTFTSAGGTGAKTWFLLGIPPGGLTMTPAGTMSGRPAQSGTFTITMQVRDSGTPPQIAQATFTMLIGPPALAPATLTSGNINVPYNQQLFLGAGVGTVTWSLNTSGHPALSWLSLSNTGVLSGTNTVFGTTPPFTVTATDSLGQSSSRTYTIFFNAPLDMQTLREGIVLETQPGISFIGGFGTRTATLIGGSLPPGLTLNSNGSFTGSPQRHGTFNFTLELRDCNPSSSCVPGSAQQVVTRNVAWRVSAKDQQGFSGAAGTVPFGGPAGRTIAQVVTVGAHGTLTGIGIGVSCPTTQTPLLVEIQRLTEQGLPDGTTIASGSAITNFNAIAVSPPIPMSIGERFAFVLSAPLSCNLSNPPTFDNYNAGDAYVNDGAGWATLFDTDGRYDVPSFRSLIQPEMDVTYLFGSHGGTTATLLNDGNPDTVDKVLIAGNSSGVVAELFDPATNTTTTTGSLSITRLNATATQLGDGRVLLAGGRDQSGNRLSSAEIYDPIAGTFSPTSGPMTEPREHHRAVWFTMGGVERVLITGGQNNSSGNLQSAELFDPVTGTFSAVNNMLNGRQQHVAEWLGGTKILVAAGYTCCTGISAEVFDTSTNTFTATTGPMIVSNRGAAAAAVLADGTVLITGGQSGDLRNEAELYDPVADSDGNPATPPFAAAGTMQSKRYLHTATRMPDNSVVIAGGYDATSFSSYTLPLASVERYVPGTGFLNAGGMETRRAAHAAVALGSSLLLTGGFSQSWMTGNTVEVRQSSAVIITPATLPDATPNVAYAPVTLNLTGGTGAGEAITHFSGALPGGMTYDTPTRTLSGTPLESGVFPIGFRGTDSGGNEVVQTLTLRVGAGNVITSQYRLPDAAQNQPYNVQLTATGAAPIAWSLLPAANGLPAGITLSASGLLSNAPTQLGYFNFGVRAIDANGVEAIKILSINVQSAMTINTTTLGTGTLFGAPACINVSNGVLPRTYSISAGTPPPGMTIGSNGCWVGFLTQTGTFTFTVRVEDSSMPPQVVTRQFTLDSWAEDQNSGFGSLTPPPLTFGGSISVAERVIAGIDGTLKGVRLNAASCPAGAVVTAQVQGLRPDGAPDGNVLASGQSTTTFAIISLTPGVPFAADARFAVVFSSDQSCTVRPGTFDAYPGEGYIAASANNWQSLQNAEGRPDIPMQTWIETATGVIAMNWWRGEHAAVTLQNGKVLLLGNGPNPIDLFDPATNTFTPVASGASVPRTGQTATLLDSGHVLIAGGMDNTGNVLSSMEIFNPATSTFTPTVSMNTARKYHTATLLPDGKVLLAGGLGEFFTTLQSAEVFDPATGGLTQINMQAARQEHTATLLGDGRVLIAGGFMAGFGPTAELFNYGAQTFTATDGGLLTPRGRHTATALADGTVLIAGGTGNNETLSSAEIFEPSPAGFPNGRFVSAPGMFAPRDSHTATRLSDGSVLVGGGLYETWCCNMLHEPQASMERYVPGTGWVHASSMRVARYNHTASPISGGRVLLAGTYGWSSAGGRLAEIYDPAAESHFAGSGSPTGLTGVGLSHFLQPEGSTPAFNVDHVSGALPPGISFSEATATISGTPTQPGTFTSTFRITDGAARETYETVKIRINPVIITTASLPTIFTGVPYTSGLSGSGVGGIQSWQIINGTLPDGILLNGGNGEISGTTTDTCCFGRTIVVRATDSIGQTATKTIVFDVQNP